MNSVQIVDVDGAVHGEDVAGSLSDLGAGFGIGFAERKSARHFFAEGESRVCHFCNLEESEIRGVAAGCKWTDGCGLPSN